jgi:phosphate transport system substrate-binding protein
MTALLPVFLLMLTGCQTTQVRPMLDIRLAGAQIPVELVASWLQHADQYRFDVEQVEPVYLSQHGFQNLRDKNCDLACTDRLLTSREYETFAERNLTGYRVAFYGCALYVHPENPLDSIYAGHLEPLFRRKLTDWRELGAAYEGPIRLIGPHKSTRGGMVLMRQAGVWFDDATWEALDSDAAIVDAVAADPSALGFASIGFDQNVRYLGLRMRRTDPPAFPSLEEIESERYGLAKVIYVYLPADPSPAAAAALDFLFSEAGRRAIESTRVWPVSLSRAPLEMPQ